jgi:sodium/potassium/calcium exchanger 6
VGNSIADLVANATIAQFAPNMAYAACFGGPMLNLLLGIGGSGSYSILMSPTHKPVTINFSPTLWVSGTGLILILVGTAVIVPFNRFFIDRRWAICLLVGYAVIMTTNVVVEVRSERRS